MVIISHRGNIKGPNPQLENNPDHIRTIIQHYDCEIDVWKVGDKIFLGHDNPQYPVDVSFFNHIGLWCHAKNLEALQFLLELGITCFYHNIDDFTLTNNRYIWTYPGKPVTRRSIIVDLSTNWIEKNYDCYGVCVDYIL